VAELRVQRRAGGVVMSDPRKLIVVQAPTSAVTLRELLVAAPPGVRVEVAFRERVALAEPGLVEVARRLFPTHVVSDAGLARLAAAADGMVTFADSQLDVVDDIMMGLGRPSARAGAWRKLVQRRLLVEAGISALRFGVLNDAGRLRGVLDEVGLPAVLKADRGAGGHGVYLIAEPYDVDAALTVLDRGPWVVEGVAPFAATHPRDAWLGNLVSVESASFDGSHHHLTSFAKFPVQVVHDATGAGLKTVRVCGDVHPANLPEDLLNEAIDVTHRALDVLQVRNRVTHTELLINGSGVEIVEVNGRIGGFLSRLLRRTCDIDMGRIALTIAAGLTPTVPAVTAGAACAAGFFPSFENLSGTVRSRVAPSDLHGIGGVDAVHATARYGDPRSASDGRMCNIVLEGTDRTQLRNRFEAAYGAVQRLFAADREPVA
jgi:hypothetical protein